MDTFYQIERLGERQTALLAVMAESDSHAAKCAKLGLDFKTSYPEDYAAYTAANEEYNANETKMEELRAKLEEERAAETRRPEEEGAPEI
jgi:hypothetical protein